MQPQLYSTHSGGLLAKILLVLRETLIRSTHPNSHTGLDDLTHSLCFFPQRRKIRTLSKNGQLAAGIREPTEQCRKCQIDPIWQTSFWSNSPHRHYWSGKVSQTISLLASIINSRRFPAHMANAEKDWNVSNLLKLQKLFFFLQIVATVLQKISDSKWRHLLVGT